MSTHLPCASHFYFVSPLLAHPVPPSSPHTFPPTPLFRSPSPGVPHPGGLCGFFELMTPPPQDSQGGGGGGALRLLRECVGASRVRVTSPAQYPRRLASPPRQRELMCAQALNVQSVHIHHSRVPSAATGGWSPHAQGSSSYAAQLLCGGTYCHGGPSGFNSERRLPSPPGPHAGAFVSRMGEDTYPRHTAQFRSALTDSVHGVLFMSPHQFGP